jgi:EpsI family protein
MEFTATFTVWAVNLTGIPVLREGLYFFIPSGVFEVARACSGIRYILATITLSTLYAYLAFGSLRKRVLFLALAIVVPIVANALRAYGIVIIAHLSEMRFAVGADHLLYGWVFFGLVMALLFWIGNKFRDDHVDVGRSLSGGDTGARQVPALNTGKVIPVLGLALLCIALGPTLLWRTSIMSVQESDSVASIPFFAEGWRLISASDPEWRPVFFGASTEMLGKYTDGEHFVDLALLQYEGQIQGGEIVNARNSIASVDDWQILFDKQMKLQNRSRAPQKVRSVFLVNPVSRRLIWYWYDVNGQSSVSSLGVKILEGKNFVLGRSRVSSLLAVSVRIDESEDNAQRVLNRFLDMAIPSIERCIRQPASTPACVRAEQDEADL